MSKESLPEVNFVDTDPEKIKSNIITLYEAIAQKKLYPGDPVRLFLLALAQIIIQQRILINDTGKQNLLAYARAGTLDHKGDFFNTPRLEEQYAKTTFRFTLSTPLSKTEIIPGGIRGTPNGKIFFATREPITILAGETSIEVIAECSEPGEIGNGWQPGQINKIVDPLPFIATLKNITESNGGAEKEDDESYRERIRQAPEKFSTAGPDGAYIYWAKTAHQSIVDVEPLSPSPGVVDLVILLENGEIPGPEILQLVEDACNDKTKRPLTDCVNAHAAEEMPYNLDLTYYINPEHAASVNAIMASVEKAVEEYVLWQKLKLGRDINPSELIRRVGNAGAKRVEIVSPAYTALNRRQVAKAQTISINFGGFEDD